MSAGDILATLAILAVLPSNFGAALVIDHFFGN